LRKHTKIYLDWVKSQGLLHHEIICEVCEAKAVDIAHIIPRSKFGSRRKEEQDNIKNLMALCRNCHYAYDFENKWTKEEMQEIHDRNL